MSEQGKPGFLVVSRCVGQSIVVGDNVTITVQEIRTGQVRIGIQAPRNVRVDRSEIRDRKLAQEAAGHA